MGKSLGTHLHLWGFQFTHVYAPSLPAQPKKQRWTRVSRTFRVSTLHTRWAEGELQENVDIDALFNEGTQPTTESYEYFITFPRTFLSRIVGYKRSNNDSRDDIMGTVLNSSKCNEAIPPFSLDLHQNSTIHS